jgi:hypothetical protein
MTPEQLAAITDIDALRAAALAMVDSQLQRIAERDQRIASQQRQIQTLDLTV